MTRSSIKQLIEKLWCVQELENKEYEKLVTTHGMAAKEILDMIDLGFTKQKIEHHMLNVLFSFLLIIAFVIPIPEISTWKKDGGYSQQELYTYKNLTPNILTTEELAQRKRTEGENTSALKEQLSFATCNANKESIYITEDIPISSDFNKKSISFNINPFFNKHTHYTYNNSFFNKIHISTTGLITFRDLQNDFNFGLSWKLNFKAYPNSLLIYNNKQINLSNSLTQLDDSSLKFIHQNTHLRSQENFDVRIPCLAKDIIINKHLFRITHKSDDVLAIYYFDNSLLNLKIPNEIQHTNHFTIGKQSNNSCEYEPLSVNNK